VKAGKLDGVSGTGRRAGKSPVPMEDPWLQLKAEATIQILQPLLEKFLSVPATSAPVEQVFS